MPTQPFAVGVTVIVAVIGFVVVLVAVNAAIFPVPFAPNPMAVLLFVHVKVAPAVGLVKFVTGTVAAAHKVMLAGTTTVGVGFTVIV